MEVIEEEKEQQKLNLMIVSIIIRINNKIKEIITAFEQYKSET